MSNWTGPEDDLVDRVEVWLASQHTTIWSTFDLYEGDGLSEAAEWFARQWVEFTAFERDVAGLSRKGDIIERTDLAQQAFDLTTHRSRWDET